MMWNMKHIVKGGASRRGTVMKGRDLFRTVARSKRPMKIKFEWHPSSQEQSSNWRENVIQPGREKPVIDEMVLERMPNGAVQASNDEKVMSVGMNIEEEASEPIDYSH